MDVMLHAAKLSAANISELAILTANIIYDFFYKNKQQQIIKEMSAHDRKQA